MMSSKQKVSLIVALVVAAVAAFMFASRGRQTAQPENAALSEITPDTTRTQPAELRIGNAFPNVTLIAEPDSTEAMAQIASRDVIAGRETLILFVAPNCDPCSATVRSWSESLTGLPSDLLLIGVINTTPEERNGYRVLTDAGFPIYSDSDRTFGRDYGVAVYPTLVGVDASGNVAFVQNAVDSTFTPSAAVDLLRASVSR